MLLKAVTYSLHRMTKQALLVEQAMQHLLRSGQSHVQAASLPHRGQALPNGQNSQALWPMQCSQSQATQVQYLDTDGAHKVQR